MAKRGRKPAPALEPEPKSKRYSVATANPDVQRWVEAQSNRSASFEMLIRLFMKLYDVEEQDIFETLMDNPLLLGGLRQTRKRESDRESTIAYHDPAAPTQSESLEEDLDVDEDEETEVDEEVLDDEDLNEDEDDSEDSEDEDEETEVDEPEEVEEETKVEETKRVTTRGTKGAKSTKSSSSASKTGTRKKRTPAKKRNLKGDDFFG